MFSLSIHHKRADFYKLLPFESVLSFELTCFKESNSAHDGKIKMVTASNGRRL